MGLIGAAVNGHLPVVQYLHQHGADIAVLSHRALTGAAENGHLPVVQYLHQHGADITAQNNSPMISAAGNGHLPVVDYLCAQDNMQIIMALMSAADRGQMPVVQYILDKYPSIFSLSDLGPDQQQDYEAYGAACKEWRQTVRREPPPGLYDQDPRFFKGAAYEFMLPLLAEEGYGDKTANNMAFMAAGLFQSPVRAMQYLKAWGTAGKQPLHDIIHMIKLPQKRGQMNVKDWGDAVLKCGPSMAKLVQFADRVPSPARSSDGRTWSSVSTREICAQFGYKRAAEHPALAALCLEHDVNEANFETALGIVQKGPPALKNLPEITIAGEKFDMLGGKFYRLPADDIRGLFLGELTDCCQSIGSEGRACAKYGYESENGGFYVVENAKGRVISQTFAWRAHDGGLCFDTLETLGQNVTAAQWHKILKEAANKLGEGTDHNISRLTVGLGGDTPHNLTSIFGNATVAATPLDYTGYSEAQEQLVVWQRSAQPA